MPVYSFAFPGAVTGSSVSILNTDGTVAATGTLGSPDTSGDIAHEVTLAEGDYRAVLTEVPTGVRQRPGPVVGILDVPDSIALSTSPEDYYFEIVTPIAIGAGIDLSFDTIPDSVTKVSDAYRGMSAGYYRIDATVEFTQPAELHVTRLFVAVEAGYTATFAPHSVYPHGSPPKTVHLRGQVHIPVASSEDGLIFSMDEACADGTASPTSLEISYAYFSVSRVG